jgi:ATP-dependent DNA helicase DinG
MVDYLQDTFGPGGYLARLLTGYEARKGQVEMAETIDRAIDGCESAIIEAPTGTGKGQAYLAPVTYWLKEHGKRIVEQRPPSEKEQRDGPDKPRAIIVTANIALQEQLISKDVPLLQQAVPWSFSAKLLKGRGNFLCLDRYEDTMVEYSLLPPRDPAERARFRDVVKWAEVTKTGDFSELDFELLPSLKQKVAVSADDCLGRACPRHEECWSEQARRGVKQADVIVTNYHLFFTHLSLQAECGAGVLPPFDIVVFDEAHAAADIAKDFFGFKINFGQIKYATRLLAPSKGKRKRPVLDEELGRELHAQAEMFFRELADVAKSRDYHARLVHENVVPGWQHLTERLLEVRRLYLAIADEYGESDVAYAEELRRAARRCSLIAQNIKAAMELDCEEGERERVYFIEHDERTGRTQLCSMPLKVDDVLRSLVFENPAIRSAIATSATLATKDKSLDFIACELGAEAAIELVTESPFDFASQCLLVIPPMPDPKRPEYPEAVASAAVEVARASRGRMLGLFTSYRSLNLTAERLRAHLGDQYTVLVQGTAPRMQLVERFKIDVSSILLGTKSFWAGVDVPGEALSCVLLDRIPFDPPDDPIVDAMAEISKDSFMRYQVPRAAIELKQGFGRLIRSATDRGVVVCLDRRIVESGWGRSILRALPKARVSRELSDVAHFFGTGG